MVIRGQGNGGVAIAGLTDGTSFSSGYVGETISNTVTFASATSYVSTTTTNVTSINVPIGNFDIYANAGVSGSVSSQLYVSISTSSGVQANVENRALLFGSASLLGAVAPSITVSISSPTTYYLVINATSTGSPIMFGNIWARRRI